MDSKTLFDEVVKLCGFSAMMGPGTLRRALRDSGVTRDNAGPDDYRKALPQIQARIEVYVPAAEAATRIRRIMKFLDELDQRAEPSQSERRDDWADDHTEFGRRKFGRSIQILREVREQLKKHIPTISPAPDNDKLSKAPDADRSADGSPDDEPPRT
jgi:hypothetical protein